MQSCSLLQDLGGALHEELALLLLCLLGWLEGSCSCGRCRALLRQLLLTQSHLQGLWQLRMSVCNTAITHSQRMGVS